MFTAPRVGVGRDVIAGVNSLASTYQKPLEDVAADMDPHIFCTDLAGFTSHIFFRCNFAESDDEKLKWLRLG